MCIILPVDHIPCTHTVAIWQHCVNAPRLANGLRPCSRIRQHARPILTRKLCYHCGGPRYFARRGGLAEQGSGSPTISDIQEEKDEQNEPYDSGYQSDVIHEEDEEEEDDESTISPRASTGPVKRWRDAPRQYPSSKRRSPSRRPSWRPNLKRDMSAERTWYRPESIDSAISKFDDENDHSSHPSWSSEELALLQRSVVPTLRRPSPKRKSSTLLHPSPPLDTASEFQNTHSVSLDELIPPATPPQPSESERQGSTLLHPSSPDLEPTTDLSNAKSFTFTLSLPLPINTQPCSTSAPTLRRPGPPPRNNSTLLHPSSPTESPRSSTTGTPLVILSKPPMSMPPTPDPTPTKQAFQRPGSILHSAFSDDEWEEPLHSSHSDVEYESDDHSAEGDTESFSDNAEEQIVVARTGRMARASRISFHGNQLRILKD